MMNLIIDEGNTRIKLAVFDKNQLIDLELSTIKSCSIDLKHLFKKYAITSLILSSVTDEVHQIVNTFSVVNKVILSCQTPLPFTIAYKTPKTLGVDRLALMAAAWQKFPNKNALVIDAGTCITYDFINAQGKYLGGAISLGLQMRLDSLHSFTKKLPKVTVPNDAIDLIGQTTEQSMQSGVLNGMVFEIQGMIKAYQQQNADINIILTGGNASFLYKQLKNSIFVNPNFLLEGLNAVLRYQRK